MMLWKKKKEEKVLEPVDNIKTGIDLLLKLIEQAKQLP